MADSAHSADTKVLYASSCLVSLLIMRNIYVSHHQIFMHCVETGGSVNLTGPHCCWRTLQR